MARCKLIISLPWWSGVYVNTCIAFSKVLGLNPDQEKIAKKIIKHSKVKSCH